MTRCFGLLGSGQAADSERVGLAVEDDMLTAIEPGGTSWNIPLDRVHLVSWSSGELQLELAGTEVSFVPEDPDAALAQLVPALLARQQRGVAVAGATVAGGVAPPGAPQTPDLTVDLSDPEQIPVTTPVRPVPSDRGAVPSAPVRRAALAPAAVVVPPVRSRRRWYWWFVVVAMVVGAILATQLGNSSDPAGAARQAISDGGLPAVTVLVDGRIATLTGAVPSQQVAEDIAATVATVAGIDSVTSNLSVPAPTPTTIPITEPDPGVVAASALAAAGFPAAVVSVDAGVALLSGTVASEFDRRAAATAVSAVDGVNVVDNQLRISPVPDDTIQTAARVALDGGGFESISVSVQDGVAIVAGTVPPEVLGNGFFRYSTGVEESVLQVAGVSGLTNRLQLAGDEATLRRQLRELTDSAPVIFALGRAELSTAAAATLDSAAGIIQAQPGLRVLIAGHTDTTGSAGRNEELSGQRAQAVRTYLVEQGIAANRLLVVAYGELFPTTPGAQPADRRVEFEVAG